MFSGKFAPRVRFLSLLGTSAGYLIQRVPGNTFLERTFRGGPACTYLTGLQGKDNVDARLIHQIMGREVVVANTGTRSRGKVRHQRNAREPAVVLRHVSDWCLIGSGRGSIWEQRFVPLPSRPMVDLELVVGGLVRDMNIDLRLRS